MNNGMSVVTLKAHFDGKHICLDKPIDLPANARLMVTVFSDLEESPEEERQAWLAASQAWLARAYGDDEPDYSNAMLRETPPRE
jgi:hypothetical protein